jgi:chemotaxis protein MotB
VDTKKFAQLASGLAESFGTPIAALTDSGASSDAGILDAMPAPVDVQRVEPAGQDPSQSQVDAAAAKAAAQQAARVQAEAKGAYDQLAAIRDQIDAALTAAGYAGAAQYQIDERGLVVHVVSDPVLFAPESATLLSRGATVLDAMAPTLAGLPNQIRVEGHANSLPVTKGGPWPSNWELSAVRATTVLRHLSESDGVPEDRMSAAGYGSTRPLVPDTDKNYVTVNRRVDVVMLSTASAEANALLPSLAAATP